MQYQGTSIIILLDVQTEIVLLHQIHIKVLSIFQFGLELYQVLFSLKLKNTNQSNTCCIFNQNLLINDTPYGTEKAWNALRIAMQFQRDIENVEVRVFLMADGVFCSVPNDTTPMVFIILKE